MGQNTIAQKTQKITQARGQGERPTWMKEQGFKAKVLGAEGTIEVITKNMIVPEDAEGAYFVFVPGKTMYML